MTFPLFPLFLVYRPLQTVRCAGLPNSKRSTTGAPSPAVLPRVSRLYCHSVFAAPAMAAAPTKPETGIAGRLQVKTPRKRRFLTGNVGQVPFETGELSEAQLTERKHWIMLDHADDSQFGWPLLGSSMDLWTEPSWSEIVDLSLPMQQFQIYYILIYIYILHITILCHY